MCERRRVSTLVAPRAPQLFRAQTTEKLTLENCANRSTLTRTTQSGWTRARAPFAARASFRPRNQTASLWTKLRNCQTAVDLLASVAQGWICSDSHRKISRLVTKKKREKTERRVSETAAWPADRPDASSHRARAPTSPREVIAHHRREPGTLEPGRLTARRTPPARETPAKRTENAGYRADTGDTTPRVTGKGAMRAGREARRGSGEMPRHGR